MLVYGRRRETTDLRPQRHRGVGIELVKQFNSSKSLQFEKVVKDGLLALVPHLRRWLLSLHSNCRLTGLSISETILGFVLVRLTNSC